MIDLRSVIPVGQMKGDDAEDTWLLRRALDDASAYLRSFRWCSDIREEYFGCGLGGIVAVFLFRIEPVGSADEWLWVVTGDLPIAYLVTDEASTPIAALEIYCDLMDDWVGAVRAGSALEEVFPVAMAPTEANADALEGRLDFLRREILPHLASPRGA